MKISNLILQLLRAATLLSCAAAADAQVVRTFVATTGVDSNPCSSTLPCRNFQAAIAAVSTGGEVVALDSGGYGPFIVTKSVAVIVPRGIHAAIAPTETHGVLVQAGPTEVVTLRGLYLNNRGAIDRAGINFPGGGVLHVEDCEIAGFPRGIDVFRTEPAGEEVQVSINDSTIRDGFFGIRLLHEGTGSVIEASINRCRLKNNNGPGLTGRGGARVTASDVISVGNGNGMEFVRFNSGTVVATLNRCVISHNRANGVTSNGDSIVRLNECTITQNLTGMRICNTNCAGISLGNNLIEGNGTDVVGPLVVFPAK